MDEAKWYEMVDLKNRFALENKELRLIAGSVDDINEMLEESHSRECRLEADLAAAKAKLSGQESEILSLRSALNVFEDEVKSIAGSVNGSWREVTERMQERIRHLEALVALPCPQDHEAKLAEAEKKNEWWAFECKRHVDGHVICMKQRDAAEAKLAEMTKERDEWRTKARIK